MRSGRIRFAFRLAISLGIDDPLTWIDSVHPSVIDAWIAYDRVEPIPRPWDQTATVAMEVYRVAMLTASKNGHELDPKSRSDFMPATESPSKRPMSVTDMSQWAAKMVGME